MQNTLIWGGECFGQQQHVSLPLDTKLCPIQCKLGSQSGGYKLYQLFTNKYNDNNSNNSGKDKKRKARKLFELSS